MSSLAQEIDGMLASSNPSTPRREDRFLPWKDELKSYAEEMKRLRFRDPDDALAWLSSVGARTLEMQIHTHDFDDRASTKFRIEMILPFKQELASQFSIASRRFSVAEMDLKLSGGQPT